MVGLLGMFIVQNWSDIVPVVQVLCHVTTRLQRLHAAGLAHRDLKPGKFSPPCIS
jgi:serine/threonine protein kinase